MAKTDLDIIEQIENALSIKLAKLEDIDYIEFIEGYTLNHNGQITGLSLYTWLDPYGIKDLQPIISFLKDLKQLQSLNLSRNEISDYSFLKELPQLQSLNLSKNQITDISFLKELPQLQSLNLSKNQIRDISFLKELPQLQSLNLSENQITDISFLKELPQLQSLNLSKNQITDISFLKNLNQLQSLHLINNDISDVSALKGLVNLKYLNLSGNQLSDISAVQYLTNLTELWIYDIQIKDISPLRELKQLRTLQLANNKISDISPLKQLKNLNLLSLPNNKIEELPSWITDFNMEINFNDGWSNGKITLGKNPLKSPPTEIVKQGKEAVRDYFKSLEGKNKVKLNEVKVLLVGEGMAGKTSLLKQLQNLQFNKDESQTHGINVVTLQPQDIPGFQSINEIKDCQLHFWDFGGQEIMHASHQFFMSKRSLYILVLDSRTDSKKYHWLKHIEKFGGDSPLIVVMNKIDDNPNYNIEQKQINDGFPNIKNRFHRISCKTKEGIPGLIKRLAAAIPETSLFGTEISEDWMKIKNKLVAETKAKNYINQDQFRDICKENEVIDKSSQDTLLQYLNDLGVVLYFKQLNLANIYVLDPHWVTIGVYKIINSEKIKDGILKEQDLEYILNKEKIKKDEYDPAKEKNITYNPQEQIYLVNIMMQFELCYKYDKRKNHYIIPDLLPQELQNEPELDRGKPLRFVMEYDYLPSPIISRLMLRFKNDIADRQQWKYGMILDNAEFGCQAKVKADEQSKTINITVQGEHLSKQRYFSAIRHSISTINKEFENLKIKESIPLPGHPDETVEYQELLGYEQMGKDEYFSGKLLKSFSVSEMLDSIVSKEERSKEQFMPNINFNVSNIGNPQVNTNLEANLEAKLTATQQQTLTQEIKTVQGLFKNLKEDLIEEVELEIEDEKEQKRIKNELQKIEKAFSELEQAASDGQKQLNPATKNRLEEFIDNLSDEDSRINKALKLVSNGAQKVQKLGRTYNKVAPYFALPSIPPVLLGNEDK
ncbi:MAG: COR domain-containing protein [Xenococcus sp. MO_188.B8]|nr:COR domain-containing protein [Xenococcus sp. MO_188.B8]